MSRPKTPERPWADRAKREVRETFRSLIWAFVLFLIIRTLAFQAFRIPSPSMEDTLLIHDFLFISKLTYGPRIPFTNARLPGLREPKPGDVIVFENPSNPKEDYIKRCVAVGGQTIEYRNKVLYVDGVKQDEPYVKHADSFVDPRRDSFGPIRVPQGQFFMMGDNRDNSRDSRAWGMLPKERIHGKAVIIYFSFNKYIWQVRLKRLLMRIR